MNRLKMISRMLSAVALAGLLSVAAAQQDNAASTGPGADNAKTSKTSSRSGTSDKKFIKEAADGGLAEVELGQLAVEKASSNDVKKFGQRMVDDHSKANDELKQLAATKGVDLPQEPSAKHKATNARLS